MKFFCGETIRKHLISTFILLLVAERVKCHEAEKLMVILLDGFRWDYLSDSLPGFSAIVDNGLKAEKLKPVFPSVSFTNYYSIMTGLYPESHGMIGNFMYDAQHNSSFVIGTTEERLKPYWWDQGEPAWIAAVRQHKRSYMYYWPGCEVEIRGLKPTYCDEYRSSLTIPDLHSALESGVGKFHNNSADFIGVYVELTDHLGHQYGPKSSQIKTVVEDVDKEISWLLGQVESFQLTDKVNIMVVSDHGTTDISPDRAINMSMYLDMDDIEHSWGNGPLVSLWPTKEKTKEIYDNLKGKDPHMQVFLKDEIPEKWHYKNNARVAPISLLADLGWEIIMPGKTFPQFDDTGLLKANHGYDNDQPDMGGIFLAVGPSFKKNVTMPSIYNVELYQIMCYVLNIKSLDNNGTWSNVSPYLVGLFPEPTGPSFNSLYFAIGLGCAGAILVGAFLFGSNWYQNNRRIKYRTLDPEHMQGDQLLQTDEDYDDDEF